MVRSIAVVIPCCRESQTLGNTIRALEQSLAKLPQHQSESVFVVPVVNHPLQCDDATRTDNRRLLEALSRYSGPLRLFPLDLTQPGLSHGVGEARDRGARYAVDLGLLDTDLIQHLDADCEVDEDYLPFLFSIDSQRIAAFTVGFAHPVTQESTAILLYELFLRYMKWQWTRIGVPFDFYPIGSCMGTRAGLYVKLGGIPLKNATEDFHFLNKIIKFNKIKYFPKILVYPSSRTSNRVHLGTGHFISRYDGDRAPFPILASPTDFDTIRALWMAIQDGYETSKPWNYGGPIEIRDFILESGLDQKLLRIRENSASKESFVRKLPQVFDALVGYRMLRKITTPKGYGTSDLLDWCARMVDADTREPHRLLLEFRRLDEAWTNNPPPSSSLRSEAPCPP